MDFIHSNCNGAFSKGFAIQAFGRNFRLKFMQFLCSPLKIIDIVTLPPGITADSQQDDIHQETYKFDNCWLSSDQNCQLTFKIDSFRAVGCFGRPDTKFLYNLKYAFEKLVNIKSSWHNGFQFSFCKVIQLEILKKFKNMGPWGNIIIFAIEGTYVIATH